MKKSNLLKRIKSFEDSPSLCIKLLREFLETEKFNN